MFKISELNPKDKTLDEIHKIQEKIHKEDKGLTTKELVQKYNNSVRAIAKEYKINFNVISQKELHK